MKRFVTLAPLFLATAAFAGPYDQPYSIVTVETAKSADIHLRRVIVNRVDGETILDNRAVIAPGMHKVTLDLPARKGFKTATQRELDLETKPCTRYNVAAKLANSLGQEWTPVVRSEEPIGECKAKFKVGG